MIDIDLHTKSLRSSSDLLEWSFGGDEGFRAVVVGELDAEAADIEKVFIHPKRMKLLTQNSNQFELPPRRNAKRCHKVPPDWWEECCLILSYQRHLWKFASTQQETPHAHST